MGVERRGPGRAGEEGNARSSACAIPPTSKAASWSARRRPIPSTTIIYRDNVEAIRAELETAYPTLHLVGRNGMHRYNNQDHAMMTAMLTVRNIQAGRRAYDIWAVNEDAEYHEAGDEGAQAALASERLVPKRLKAA